MARGRVQGEDRTEAPVDERAFDPLLEQFCHQIDRIAFADASEVHPDPVLRRADQAGIGVQFERRQPRANRDVERAARHFVEMAGNQEALER